MDMQRKRKIAIGITIAILVLGVFLIFRLFHLFTSINTKSSIWGKAIPKEKKIFSILIMGYGGAGHEGAYLTDTMMVVRFDFEKNSAIIVSIPRDVWVQIPTKKDEDGNSEQFYRKINSVYQTGLFKQNYPGVPEKYAGEQGASELIKESVAKIEGFE